MLQYSSYLSYFAAPSSWHAAIYLKYERFCRPARSGSLRQPELILFGAESPVQPLGVVVEHGLAEVRLVEDALEDVLVRVHAPDDGVEEGAVEDEAEVLEVVVAGASSE